MSDFRGSWVPENSSEEEFLLGVHEQARTAFNRGMDVEDIASAMNFLAASMLLHEGPPRASSIPEPDPPDKVQECPKCGEEISEVDVLGLGDRVFVLPCEHRVSHSQVAGWLDDPAEVNQ